MKLLAALLATTLLLAPSVAGAADDLSTAKELYAAAAYEASDQPESALVYRRLAAQALGDSTVSRDFPELVAVARAAADSALWRGLLRRSGIKPNPGSSKERKQ